MMKLLPETGDLSRTHRWLCAAVLSLSLLVVTMDLTILDIAIPDLTKELHPSSTQVLWIVDGYSLVLAGLLITVSALADRWGRSRTLIAGFAVFGIASGAAAFVHSAELIIVLRGLLGVGGAMIMPATLSLLRAVFHDPRERATALGLWAAVASMGAAVGPLIGGVLIEHFSWRAAFFVNVPLMVLAIVAGLAILPESRSQTPGRVDLVGVVTSIVGMGAVTWAIKHFGAERSLLLPEGWFGFIVGVVLLWVFVRRCLTRPEPMLDMRLFALRPFTGGVVAALGAVLALAAAMFVLSQWLQLVKGYGPLETGWRLMPAALAGLVVSLVAPPLALRVGPRVVLVAALVVAGFGMVLLGAWPHEPGGGIVTVAVACVGAGGGALAVGSAMMMANTPEDRAGNAAAIEEVSYEVGNLLGVAIFGSLAAIVYRTGVTGHHVLDGVPAETARVATDSVGGALDVAQRLHLPELARTAAHEYSHAMQVTSLCGGVTMLVVALLVWLIVPRGTSIEGVHLTE